MLLGWRPDTCDCEFEYNGPNDTAHLTRIVRLCPDHANHDAAHADNVLKNQAITAVEKALAPGRVNPEDIAWRFDSQRQVYVSLPAYVQLTGLERADLASALLRRSSRIVLE
jgi:hypothetical protein